MSGGELVAAALKSAGGAVIIGERTAGKGSVQTVYRLPSGHAVQVTTAVLAGPDGLAYNKRGLQPDVEVVEAARYLLHSEVEPGRLVKLALGSLDGASVNSNWRSDIK